MARRPVSPWVRLQTNYTYDAKVRRAGAGAVWPWVLCRLHDGGGVATDDDLAPDLAAVDLGIEEDQAAGQLEGLKRVRLLIACDEGWRTPSWDRYRPPSTVRTRRKRARDEADVTGSDGDWDASGRSETLRDGTGRDGTLGDVRGRPGTSGDAWNAGNPTGRDGTERDEENPEGSLTAPPSAGARETPPPADDDPLAGLPIEARQAARDYCDHAAAGTVAGHWRQVAFSDRALLGAVIRQHGPDRFRHAVGRFLETPASGKGSIRNPGSWLRRVAEQTTDEDLRTSSARDVLPPVRQCGPPPTDEEPVILGVEFLDWGDGSPTGGAR